LVGKEECWLFVDSRYYEQAKLQVDPSLIRISFLGQPEELNLLQVLEKMAKEAARQNSSFRIGFDPFTISVEQWQKFYRHLAPAGADLVSLIPNLVDESRAFTPKLALSSLLCLPVELTGATVAAKMARVREYMTQSNTEILPITNLNQIAWLFNLRGRDLPFTPVFIAYSIITLDCAYLFTHLERVSPEIKQALAENAVTLYPYERSLEKLREVILQHPRPRISIDPKHTNAIAFQILMRDRSENPQIEIVCETNPVERIKFQKNPAEIQAMVKANLKASRAKVRVLKWLSERLVRGLKTSELDVKEAIEGFYQEKKIFTVWHLKLLLPQEQMVQLSIIRLLKQRRFCKQEIYCSSIQALSLPAALQTILAP